MLAALFIPTNFAFVTAGCLLVLHYFCCRYRERARQLSVRFLDRPLNPLDTAVYWVEYVLRHAGAPHLQSAAVHLSWFQRSLLDVVAVCLSALVVAVVIAYYAVTCCINRLWSKNAVKLKTN